MSSIHEKKYINSIKSHKEKKNKITKNKIKSENKQKHGWEYVVVFYSRELHTILLTMRTTLAFVFSSSLPSSALDLAASTIHTYVILTLILPLLDSFSVIHCVPYIYNFPTRIQEKKSVFSHFCS